MDKHTGHLLVVDDNELNRDMLSRRLSRKGYTVETASDGFEALRMINAKDFDLVLLDIMMPGISGIEVLQELREHHTVSQLPIIMATAKTDSATIVESLGHGANDYVTKPLEFGEVLARVQTHLTISRSVRMSTSGSFHKLTNEAPKDKSAHTMFCVSCGNTLALNVPTCPTCQSLRPLHGWASPDTPEHPHLGHVLGGRYRLTQFLDRGAAGVVYVAKDLDLGRQYAAKVITLSSVAMRVDPEELRTRLKHEVQALVRLQNPHVVKVYEVIQVDEGVFALIMDFVKGLGLGSILKKVGPLDPPLALSLVRQIAQGLYEAHQLNFVHCDIKPDNIMLEKLPAGGYFVQILDFGVVQMLDDADTKQQGFYGTPLYSAPERIQEDANADHRSDIYSLGAVLYHMVQGVPPFVHDNVFKVFSMHLTQAPPPLGIHIQGAQRAPLEAMIHSMMAKDHDERPRDLLQVIQRIDHILSLT